MKNNLTNNIRLDYLFRFFCNFTIADGIFILFLEQKGLSLWEIGILEGVFHVTSLVTEIPSGALADLLGRKQVLLMSRLCGVISTILMLFGNEVWLLGAGFVFTAWSYNLLSGSEEALLYDSFLELGKEEDYFKTNGRLSFVAEVSQGLGIFIGGFLAKYSYVLCYLAVICTDLLAFICVLFMSEPQFKNKMEKISVKMHFDKSISLIKCNQELRYILVHYSILFAFHTSVFLYSQTYYFGRGFDEGEIGLILLGVCGCTSIGALFSEGIAKILGTYTSYVCAAVLAVGMCFMSSETAWISILGFGIGSMANASLYPLQSKELNMRIPSNQRATVISVSSMVFSMVMIILFPLIGFLANYLDLGQLIFWLGVLLLFYNCFSFIIHNKEAASGRT